MRTSASARATRRAAQDEAGIAARDGVGDVRVAVADRRDLQLAFADPGLV
jgi:hypothetical protein